VKATRVHLNADKQLETGRGHDRGNSRGALQEVRALDQDEAMTSKAPKILGTGKPGAYEKAVAP
jgi:hypothetical protein